MKDETQKHVNLAIGCKSGERLHGAFYINEKNKMICDHCEQDMTPDIINLYEKTGEYLKSIKE